MPLVDQPLIQEKDVHDPVSAWYDGSVVPREAHLKPFKLDAISPRIFILYQPPHLHKFGGKNLEKIIGRNK